MGDLGQNVTQMVLLTSTISTNKHM